MTKYYSLLNYLLFVLFLGQLMSCAKSDDMLTKVFNRNELKTIEKIVAYYDNYVISKTDNDLPIDKAYLEFFDKKAPLAKEAADFNLFLPDKNERIVFFETLDKDVLSEIYNISDTLTIQFRGEHEARHFYSPYSFSLNHDGKYVSFLKELSSRNGFFKSYYESIQLAGDISPANYAMMLHDYNMINFNKKEERLVLIVNLLHTGDKIKPGK